MGISRILQFKVTCFFFMYTPDLTLSNFKGHVNPKNAIFGTS